MYSWSCGLLTAVFVAREVVQAVVAPRSASVMYNRIPLRLCTAKTAHLGVRVLQDIITLLQV